MYHPKILFCNFLKNSSNPVAIFESGIIHVTYFAVMELPSSIVRADGDEMIVRFLVRQTGLRTIMDDKTGLVVESRAEYTNESGVRGSVRSRVRDSWTGRRRCQRNSLCGTLGLPSRRVRDCGVAARGGPDVVSNALLR